MPYYQGNISSSNSAVRVGPSTPNCYQSVQNPDQKESQERNIKQSFYSSEAPSISAEPFSLWPPNMHSSPQHTECLFSGTCRELDYYRTSLHSQRKINTNSSQTSPRH